ncbi:MAG TPA: methyltransferase domain-containing protein [Opitutaceae bacterium]|nr:methyltransferase domain-containing protein [Opitutaceae bacterium]
MDSWNELARKDAMWAVLSDEAKVGERWDPEAFFATGVSDVRGVMERLESLGLKPARTRALDFGCGVGRLTRALAPFFDEVVGVDVSDVMLEKARALRPLPKNVVLRHNPASDLSVISRGSLSFALSLIALQHVPEPQALSYIEGICDGLMSGGIAYLQLSTNLDESGDAKWSRDRSWSNRVYRWIRALFVPRPRRMDTHYCRLSKVSEILETKRMRLVAVLPDSSLPKPFVSHVVIIAKQ